MPTSREDTSPTTGAFLLGSKSSNNEHPAILKGSASKQFWVVRMLPVAVLAGFCTVAKKTGDKSYCTSVEMKNSQSGSKQHRHAKQAGHEKQMHKCNEII